MFIEEDINKYIVCCLICLYLIFVKEFDWVYISYILLLVWGIGDKLMDWFFYVKIYKLKKEEDICVLYVFFWIFFYKYI